MTDLAKARQEAAERFLAIGTAAVPEGWTVSYRKSLSGRCYMLRKVISAPRPVTRKALYIFLHECAHARLHSDGKKRPRHVEEHEAEVWAHERMRANGVPVPREMTNRARRYVARKIEQALRRGAKQIDRAALEFSRPRGRAER